MGGPLSPWILVRAAQSNTTGIERQVLGLPHFQIKLIPRCEVVRRRTYTAISEECDLNTYVARVPQPFEPPAD